MVNKKVIILVIVVVLALAIPFAVYTISPLFISNTLNEPLPLSTTNQRVDKNSSLQEYQKFNSMNEQDRINTAKRMSQNQKNVIMIGAAQINNTINENINQSIVSTIFGQVNNQQQQDKVSSNTTTTKIKTGSFIGSGDGFHNTEGLAKIIPLEADGDGRSILRLEDFKSTNGPNVHIYLATDKTASDFIDLGRLKANNGNQNYDIPFGTNVTKYNITLIWCKDFSVLFGSAQLRA